MNTYYLFEKTMIPYLIAKSVLVSLGVATYLPFHPLMEVHHLLPESSCSDMERCLHFRGPGFWGADCAQC